MSIDDASGKRSEEEQYPIAGCVKIAKVQILQIQTIIRHLHGLDIGKLTWSL